MQGSIYIPGRYNPLEKIGRRTVVKGSDITDINAARFQTWRVAIEWYPSPVDINAKKAVIFTHGKDPAAAGTLAMALWHHWVDNPIGSGREFPKPSSEADVERIPEKEFLRLWKFFHAKQNGAIRHMPSKIPTRPKAFWPADENSLIL